jgi:hypothetical protein
MNQRVCFAPATRNPVNSRCLRSRCAIAVEWARSTLASFLAPAADVRFAPKSDHLLRRSEMTLCAISDQRAQQHFGEVKQVGSLILFTRTISAIYAPPSCSWARSAKNSLSALSPARLAAISDAKPSSYHLTASGFVRLWICHLHVCALPRRVMVRK